MLVFKHTIIYKFIEEQLRKGYIRLLKSSQITPMFFVEKKNGKKYIIQNYRYLNEWTIKNNCPLPLILDIIENIGTKKVFMKLNLRQNYNNIWIKKEDEQKMVFTTPEGSFKPTGVIWTYKLTRNVPDYDE